MLVQGYNNIEEQFENIFREHFHKVEYYAYSYLRDREKAKDIAQDVFYQVWKQRGEIIFDGSPLPYLFVITKRLSLNLLRKEHNNSKYLNYQKRKYTALEFDIDSLSDVSSTIIYTKEVQSLIKKGLDKMPPTVKETLLMSRERDFTYNEIARHLGISPKTVENRISLALRILRDTLQNYLPIIIGYLAICVLT